MTDVELLAAFVRFQLNRGRNISSVDRQGDLFGSFARFIAPQALTEATTADVDGWIVEVGDPAGRIEAWRASGELYRWMASTGLIGSNPHTKARRPAGPSSGGGTGSAAAAAAFRLQPGDAELVDAFIRNHRARSLSEHTVKRRLVTFRRFGEFLHPRRIVDARPGDVDDWVMTLATPGTRHAYWCDLNALFRWATRLEMVSYNPMTATDCPKSGKPLPKPAAAETIVGAFAVATKQMQLAIMLGSLAGLRISEMATLHTDDVHLGGEPPVVHVRNAKGNKDRIVPIHPTLMALLPRFRRGYLFPASNTAGHITSQTIGQQLAAALSAASGTRVTAHQLRHRFGTEAARWSGGNVVLVGKLMGHVDPTTTMGYVGWSPTEGAAVVSKIVSGVEDDLAVRRKLRAVGA